MSGGTLPKPKGRGVPATERFSIRQPVYRRVMVESMVESLRGDLDCESLLDCVHGLTDLDRVSYRVIVENEEPTAVDEIAVAVDRERSTTYRSVQRLLNAGLVEKEQVNYERGSYCHVYAATDPAEVAADMQRILNDWYAKMGQLVREFEATYTDPEKRVPVEH